jgi:glycine betaine/proline transport system ATP-binding protein
MQDGAIIQVGTPEDLVTRPATAYVREFTRDVQRAKVISARALMAPPTSHGHAGRVAAGARVASFAARIVASERPYAVVDEGERIVGEIHRDAVIALLAGREGGP